MSEAASAAPDDVSHDLGWTLGTVLRTYAKAAAEAVTELPGGARAYQVLGLAATTAPRNQAAIAEFLNIDRTVMTYLIDDLEKAGLVERRPDPADRRSRQVLVTPQGRTTLIELRARVEAVERNILGPLSDHEVEVLRKLLARVALDTEAKHGYTDACTLAEALITD